MKYLHPNVESRVIDNSDAAIAGGGGSTALFAPFFSDLGEDNRLREYSNLSEFIKNYGNPSISKYGQSQYNAAQWLANGGRVYALRLLPDDATYANLLLKIKTDNDGKKVIPMAVPLETGNTSYGAIQASMEKLADGETPIATFIPRGRGKGYNGLGIRIDLNSNLDTTYKFRTYNFSIYDKDSLGSDVLVEGPFIGSFYSDAKSNSHESMFFADVLNKYSTRVKVIANTEAFEKITTFIINGDDVDPRSVDILSGQAPANELSGQTHSEIHWKTSGVESNDAKYEATAADLNNVLYLDKGNDGDLTGDKKDQLFAKAFTGVIDPEVLDVQGVTIDVVLDANFSKAVKAKAADFVRNREDCMFMADCGFRGSVEDTLKFRKDDFTEASYFTALFAQHCEVYDEYNGAYIKVTSPYILASKIVSVDNAYGVHYPFVGPRRGTISGVSNINFFPNDLQKELLYKNKVNYIERDPRKINFGTQVTTQAQNSSLSDISHVRTLLKIKRDAENICRDYRLEFNDSSTHAALSYDLNNLLAGYVANRACTECVASVTASEYEKIQRMAKVTVSVKFTGILERIQLDFVVGK